jgi:hypothetical protein
LSGLNPVDMQDDILQVLLYVVIGVIGVLASAYQNKQKRKQAGSLPPVKRIPRDILAEPDRDFEPGLGPLLEVFDIPRMSPPQHADESVESGPSVEEGGLLVDTQEATAELAGMKMAEEAKAGEGIPVEESFEEGQSDIQKLIAKYDAIRKELADEYGEDDIASGEIVSEEKARAAQDALPPREPIFEPRKAIIYSEILKRKEY